MGNEGYRFEGKDTEGISANDDSFSKVDGEAFLKLLRLTKEALGA